MAFSRCDWVPRFPSFWFRFWAQDPDQSTGENLHRVCSTSWHQPWIPARFWYPGFSFWVWPTNIHFQVFPREPKPVSNPCDLPATVTTRFYWPTVTYRIYRNPSIPTVPTVTHTRLLPLLISIHLSCHCTGAHTHASELAIVKYSLLLLCIHLTTGAG